MSRHLLPFALLLSVLTLGLTACGSSSSDPTRGAARGAFVFSLPFLPTTTAEVVTLGFKNPTNTAAPVSLTPYAPSGAPYGGGMTTVTVPARGELRIALSSLLGGPLAGGWIHVDTRNTAVLDPVTGEPRTLATSGFVSAYIERRTLGAGAEADVIAALAPRADEVRVPVMPDTFAVQLINHSVMEFAGGSVPLPVTFDVTLIGANGTTTTTTTVGPVAGNASVQLAFAPPFGPVGIVRVRPVGAAAAGELRRFAVSSRESTLQVNAEARHHELGDTTFPEIVDTGFDVEFGADAGGSVHDFGILMSNGSAATQSVVLQAIYRRGGLPILTTPRVFTLRPGRTVFHATTDTLSLGLETGETSWLSDLFGDVFAFTGFDAVTLHVQTSRDVDVSARHLDRAFGSFYRILPTIPRTNRACIFNMPVATSTASGTRSWISITNTTSAILRVPVRAFTPALGTEYILPDILVPAFGRVDWSPDGLQYREMPTDTVGPFVAYLRLEMVPIVGALFNGRVEARDAGGALVYMRPIMVRSN